MAFPKLVVTAGLMLANMALTMTRKIEGPRLDDLKFTGGDYGVPLPMIWGLRRMQVPIFWAEDLREVKRRRKTKGGKFNEYTYYGTWAVALAGHEIDNVTRIWFDTHLVYDMTGAGPVTPFDFGGRSGSPSFQILTLLFPFLAASNQYFTIYKGTNDQLPDPRMEATVEAEFGEGSCPAYRDTAYIVFKDMPLEKIGNRIPQVSVEILSNGTPNYPWETFDTLIGAPYRLWGFTFSSDYSTFMWGHTEEFEIWDTAARARIAGGEFATEMALQPTYGIYNSGDILALGKLFPTSGHQKLYNIGPVGMGLAVVQELPDKQDGIRVIADGDGTEHWMTMPAAPETTFYLDGGDHTMNALTGVTWVPMGYFADYLGNIWAVGRPNGTGATTAYFLRIITIDADCPAFVGISGLPAPGDTSGNCIGTRDPVTGNFVLAWNYGASGNLYLIDPADGSILDSETVALDIYNTDKQFANLPPGSTSIWLDNKEIRLSDLSTIRTITASDWKAENSSGMIYDPVNHALICAPNDVDVLTFRYLDRVGNAGVTLGQVAGDIADDCGIETHDFSNLDQTVQGWSATRGPASAMLEPLLDAYDSDIAPHDFGVRGLKRTGVSTGATLLTERFVGEPRYSVKVKPELPKAIIIDFADLDAEQQPNSVRSDRPLDATDARGEAKIDLTTLALDADEARGLADRHFRRIWNERKEYALSLTAQNIGIEPMDVRTLSLDGKEIIARCVSVTVAANDVISTQWRYDNPSLALTTSAPGANFDGRDDQTVIVAVLSKGFALDIPLIHDADESAVPQVYPLAAPYAEGAWPGATVYQAVDGEYSEELASVPSSSSSTWGYVSGVMPYANPNLWDRGTEITVTLQTGELTGATEDAVNADPMLNLAAIGSNGRWEIVQFTVATLGDPLTYTVSGFKRGRRGTEWAAELHATGDEFVLLDNADAVAMGLSEVGTGVSFKAITAGRTTGFAFGYTYQGQTLMPYAPTALEAVKESNDDWTITWTRRTRVGGAWTSGTTIPLSEASEEYEVDIMDGDTVVRTIAGLASGTATYTAAQQVTDGGDVPAGSLEYRVYQISAAVDRGFAAEATA